MPYHEPTRQYDKGFEPAANEQVTADAFEDIVSKLNQANSFNSLWWLTWISNRDRFRSLLFERLVADQNKWKRTELSGWASDWIAFAKVIGQEARRMMASRRFPAPKAMRDVRTVIMTILTLRRLSAPGPFRDEYFGDLPRWLEEAGEEPLVLGFTQGNDFSAAEAARARRSPPIATLANYSRISDLFTSALQAASVSFILPPLPLPWGGDARNLVAREIRHQRGAILEGLIVQKAVTRVLNAHPRARLIHMFENNAWERGSYIAATRSKSTGFVIGYMHCAVLSSHRKYYFPESEHASRPMPSRIVTTGPLAADALSKIGDYPEGMIRTGCALREDFSSLPIKKTAHPIRDILIVFDGLPTVRNAFIHLLNAAAQADDLVFRVRCHPQLNYAALLKLSQQPPSVTQLIQEDSSGSLQEAVSLADAVVYASSTAVFTALAMGVPVIRIASDSVFDGDPLHCQTELAQQATNPSQILDAIKYLDSLSSTQRDALADRGRRFVSEYMRKADSESIKIFSQQDRM